MHLWPLLLIFIIVIPVVLWLRERIAASAALSRARMLSGSGRADQAVTVLETAAGRGSWLGGAQRLGLRYQLIGLLMERGRYEEAAIQCRGMLSLQLRPAMEATVRSRLADCLTGLGDTPGADAERLNASRALEDAPPDAERWLAEARIQGNVRRFTEECSLLERAIGVLPESDGAARAMASARLALASANAGRPQDAIRWGEAAVALPASSTVLAIGHRAASMGYRETANVESATKHAEAACVAAISAGDRDSAAQAMVILGHLQMERGAISDAITACDRAYSMSSEVQSEAMMIKADCLRADGRYDEALESVQEALDSEPADDPEDEEHRKASIQLSAAVIEGEAGRPGQGILQLDRTEAVMDPNDDVRAVAISAVRAWLLALHGDMDSSRDVASVVGAHIETIHDGRAEFSCISHLAGAASARGDLVLAAELWERSTRLVTHPVWGPSAWYGLGEAQAALGNRSAALAAFNTAADAGIETYHVRLAGERRDAILAAAPR